MNAQNKYDGMLRLLVPLAEGIENVILLAMGEKLFSNHLSRCTCLPTPNSPNSSSYDLSVFYTPFNNILQGTARFAQGAACFLGEIRILGQQMCLFGRKKRFQRQQQVSSAKISVLVQRNWVSIFKLNQSSAQKSVSSARKWVCEQRKWVSIFWLIVSSAKK